MKETVVYVFNLIITLIISGILWSLTIGNLSEAGLEAGYIGSATSFKTSIWDVVNDAYVENYNTNTLNSGTIIRDAYDDLFESVSTNPPYEAHPVRRIH